MRSSDEESKAYDMSTSEKSVRSSLSESSSRPSNVSIATIPPAVYDLASKEGLSVSGSTLSLPVDSFAHPRQWSISRKVYDTFVVCLLEFLMTVVSNAGSSVSSDVGEELGIGRIAALACLTTVYLIGQAIGAVVFPPVCESFGGRLIYVGSSAVYAAMCLVIGLAPSIPSVVICRLVQGLLSAMPTVVATGTIENLWDAKARVWAIAAWAAAGIVGLSVGPVYAVYVSSQRDFTWRWVFNAAAIAMGVAIALAWEMRESRPCSVLRKKVRGIELAAKCKSLEMEGDASLPTLREFCHGSLFLPVKLFFTEPIVFWTSVMGATVHTLSANHRTASRVRDSFGLSARHSSLVLLIIGAGVVFSIPTRCYDMGVIARCARAGRAVEPEAKLGGFLVAAPLLAISTWWFAGSIPPMIERISPVVSMVPLCTIGFATMEFDYVLSGYLTDTYQSRAASANASMGFLRAIVSGVYPLVGRAFFEGLGANIASMMLAGIATLYAIIAMLAWKYGKNIRQKSSFAQVIESD